MIRKGSITVYLSLVMLLLFTLLFTMLEGARYQGQRVNAQMVSLAAIDSVFAEYQRELLERYEIFALDGAYMGESFNAESVSYRMKKFAQANLGSGFFKFTNAEANIAGYKLLTDNCGEAYVKMACKYMEQELAIEAVKSIIQKYSDTDEESLELDKALEDVEKGDGALGEEEYISDEECGSVTEEEKELAAGVSSKDRGILKEVLKIKSAGILAFVIDDVSKISDKATDIGKAVSKRELNSGTADKEEEITLAEDAVFSAYIGNKFGCYGDVKEESVLDYEIEYICEGKNSDRANLEKIAEKLVALREAVNIAKDVKDKDKMQRARIVAIAIAGVFVVPELISIIQAAVIAAWAFMESIDDVRALFAGEKISDLKNESVELGYKDYLEIILFIKSREKRVCRSLDIIEMNIKQIGIYSNFAADNMIVGAQWNTSLTSEKLFAGLLNTQNPFGASFAFSNEGYYTYE